MNFLSLFTIKPNISPIVNRLIGMALIGNYLCSLLNLKSKFWHCVAYMVRKAFKG